ncbi:hypothetical protein SprV_0301097100 [Sparganum proliferum]
MKSHLGENEAVIHPAIGVTDRFGHQHVLSISTPDENLVLRLQAPNSEVHRGCLLPRQNAEEGIGAEEAVFCTGKQKEETVVVEAADPARTQNSPPGSEVCPDADIEVAKDNKLIRFRHGRQKGRMRKEPSALFPLFSLTVAFCGHMHNPVNNPEDLS